LKEYLKIFNESIKNLGYKKNGSNFCKEHFDFYYIINFQKSLIGNYFFVNIGITPIGLPLLISNELVIPDKPKEYECIFRIRLDSIIPNNNKLGFSNETDLYKIIESIPNEVENWFLQYNSFDKILDLNDNILLNLINVVPILKQKAISMLKCYSCIKIENINLAKDFYKIFVDNKIDDINLLKIENYFKQFIGF